ncbi:glycosyltransferase family 4 protein [Colwellia sp. KU-HH00111]|uniref:glycosyltransferase family 4 protein n=1 Tax=Colwellia sp. KU-HH00111 TaxID=3127652 RepID=UPI0031075A4D
MNICLITTGFPPENGGGIGTYIYNLAKGFVAIGHTVHVISPTSQSNYSVEQVEKLIVHRLPKKYLPKIEAYLPGMRWSFQVYQLIKKLHKQSPIDIIEFPNWEAPGVISQLLLKIPTVVRMHTPFFETLSLDSDNISFSDKMVCNAEEWSCKKANQLISSTRCHANTIIDQYKIDIDDISIIPLGIIDKYQVLKSRDLDNTSFKILYVSRLENRKGTLAFLNSIPLIHEQYQNIQIDIIGSDRPHAPGDIKFQQYFNENLGNFSEVVTFHGFVDDQMLDRFYTEADLFVVPSVYESFGLIYVEAMMYGLPSIATIGGGIPEVITEGVDGFLTDINDSEQISKRVIELINDEYLLTQMGAMARKSFEEKYEFLIMSAKTEELYKKVVSQYATYRNS